MDEKPRPEEKEYPGAMQPVEPVDQEKVPGLPFPVVGVGASAGGLEAFIEFFQTLPAESGMAFVLVQHLAPDRESMLQEILTRYTRMPVLLADDGMAVERDHVYVIRPARTLTIQNGRLHLGEPVEKRGHRRPVDDFFRSLALEQGERAICVLLSGTGSNGTAGALSVKAAGGLCIAQDPASAKFPGMPRALIDAAAADFVLHAAEIPGLLVRYRDHLYANGKSSESGETIRGRQVIREILALVQTRLRIDFSGYKKPTLIRRIQRRMAIGQISTLDDYLRMLRQNPGEVTALADDFLIHVTGFFRDPEAWQSWRQAVIEPLVAEREEGLPIRGWVMGCSSGEEAYTVAMLLVEAAEAVGKRFEIKIFATDTAKRSLGHARAGLYPGGIESEISPERLERFFDRQDALYQVKKELREMVVFAPQNVLQDPPFSRLDLCTCRNLLIYLEPDVQRRVLSLLHFALRQGGTLLLGGSETISGSEEFYEVVDKKHRIFRRTGPSPHGTVNFSTVLNHPAGEVIGAAPENSRSLQRARITQRAHQALLDHHGPAAVVIDRQQHVIYLHGATGKYLGETAGIAVRDLIPLTREPFRGMLRAAVQQALAENKPAVVRDPASGGRRVEITAAPIEPGPRPQHFLVTFLEYSDAAVTVAKPGEAAAPSVGGAGLEEELRWTRDELQSTVAELQRSNEEMRASNEETMSVNEELQSTNEELETSKEELQSLNEELTTVNAQLQAKMDELENATNDLSSLLSSTNIGVIFLDTRFRIRRFTPAVKDLLELIPSDLGRPLSDLARKFTDDGLLRDAQEVLDNLVPREKEITSESGRIYLRRALPYRTNDNRIDGVVLTFVDIGERKQAQADLRNNERRSQLILEGIQEHAIFLLDKGGRIVTWPTGAEQVFGFTAAEASGQPLAMLATEEDRAAGVPELELEQAAKTGSAGEDRWHVRKDGRRFWGTGTLYALKENGAEVTGFIKVLRDNTNRKLAEDALVAASREAEAANEAKDNFLATVSHELRTPLAPMLLWSKMLTEEAARLSSEQVREGLEAIKKCAEEQRELIEDLVDTSRIVAGKLRLSLKPTELGSLLRSAVEAIRPAALAKGVSISGDFDPAVGIVSVDPLRIQQIVGNLLTNAVKFTDNLGRVSVQLRRGGTDVEIVVADTGQGIKAEFLPRLFEPFRQAEDATTRSFSGLGLGLSITKQLVDLHDGTIVAESDGPGQGATFTVRLPLAPLDPASVSDSDHASPAPTNFSLQGLNVLLVEDAPETRKAVTTVLLRAGAEVSAVGSADAALRQYRRRPPDVILSDIGLPGTNGHELIRQIRRLEKAEGMSPIPAIALTAYADDKNCQRALENGFQKCLTKPIEATELQAVLQNSVRPAENRPPIPGM